MANFSTDADLLKWEPEVFRVGRMPGQKLAGGTGGSTSAGNATLTDTGANFVAAGVKVGHVVHVMKTGVYDLYLAVTGVNSATQLALGAAAGIFSTQTGVSYEVYTFDPQHEEAHFELCQRFDVSPDAETDFGETQLYEARVLRRASAFRVLEGIYRAQATDVRDLFWQKAVFYGEMYAGAVEAAKVRFDTNQDGTPDVTRTGHSVKLKVEEQGDAWPG